MFKYCACFSNQLILIGSQENYGNGCLYACPTNCLNGECDTYAGHCPSCLPDYHAQRSVGCCSSSSSATASASCGKSSSAICSSWTCSTISRIYVTNIFS